MSAVRIIGIGSPFGQDRLGWLAVEALQESDLTQRLMPGTVSFHRCEQPTALPALLHDANAVVIIDALDDAGDDAGAAGTIRRLEIDELATLSRSTSTHGFDVAGALSLAEALGELPPRVLIIGIAMDPSASKAEPLTAADIEQLCEIIAMGLDQSVMSDE